MKKKIKLEDVSFQNAIRDLQLSKKQSQSIQGGVDTWPCKNCMIMCKPDCTACRFCSGGYRFSDTN